MNWHVVIICTVGGAFLVAAIGIEIYKRRQGDNSANDGYYNPTDTGFDSSSDSDSDGGGDDGGD